MAEQAGELEVKLTADFENLKKGLSNAQETLRQFGKQGEKVGKNIKSTFKRFGDDLARSRFIMAGIASSFLAAGVASVVAAGRMEQWSVSFETMLGSAEKAEKLLQEVADFAAKTPFSLPEVVKGSKNLLAFGIEGEKIIPTLKALGDVSAGLGVPMERLILNFGQVKAQAKLTGRELRDFAVAGVPLTAELAKNLNIAEKEVAAMVSAGKIGFPEVEAAFKSMSSEGGRFNNLMIKQSKTLIGIIANLKDNIIRLAIAMGDELLPFVKRIARGFMDLTGFLTALSPQVKRLVLFVGGLVTVLTGTAAALGFIITFKAAILAFLAIVGGTVGAIMVTIGGVIAVITAIATNFLGIRDAIVNSWAAILPIFQLLGKFLMQLIPGWLVTIFDTMKVVFSQAGGILSTFVSGAKSLFLGLFEVFLSLMSQILEFAIKILPEKWTSAFANFKELGIEALTTVKSEFGAVGKNALGMIKSVKTAWKTSMKTVVETQGTATEELKANIDEYQAFLLDRTNAQMDAWIEAKQKEVAADKKAKDFLQVQNEDWAKAAKSITNSAFTQFGQGMASMILDGKKFAQVMKDIMRDLTRQIIAFITSWIAKMLIFLAIKKAAGFLAGGPAGAAAAAQGGIIQEPSIITGLKSGTTILAGEAGPEAIVPMNKGGSNGQENVAFSRPNSNDTVPGASGGGGGSINISISGLFIEGNESKWQRLIRDKIVPELRRRTMVEPGGLFNRNRGAST